MLSRIKLQSKQLYLKFVKTFGASFEKFDTLSVLDVQRSNRKLHWLKSLFAIHDVDKMIELDVPWWTYPAIDRVDEFLRKRPNASVFEFGSGASTIWLARRAGNVSSVEHDKIWFHRMKSRIKLYPNISLYLAPADDKLSQNAIYHSKKEGYEGKSFEAYVETIARTRQTFDLIVIDGRARAGCLYVATEYLSSGGIIVFDNTKRRRYMDAIAASSLIVSEMPGLTPALPYREKTTLLYEHSHRS